MQSNHSAPLKPGAIARVLDTDHVSPATRRALKARVDWSPPDRPHCFGPDALATLKAVAARLIPQPDGAQRIDLAARFDARLVQGHGDGWRYDALPPDKEAMTRGIDGIERAAQARFGRGFTALEGAQQDELLYAVQKGEASTDAFEGLPQPRFFEELLAALTEIYFSHPQAEEQIGYIGMADVQGFHALGLNVRDPIEEEASLAPL